MSRHSVRLAAALTTLILAGLLVFLAWRELQPLRAQKPVKRIGTNILLQIQKRQQQQLRESCENTRGCGGQAFLGPAYYPEESKALIAELRARKPSWLRYIKAVEGSSDLPIGEPDQPRRVNVRTGIFPNDPGTELGARICRTMLDGDVASVTVWGAGTTTSTPAAYLTLATCP